MTATMLGTKIAISAPCSVILTRYTANQRASDGQSEASWCLDSQWEGFMMSRQPIRGRVCLGWSFWATRWDYLRGSLRRGRTGVTRLKQDDEITNNLWFLCGESSPSLLSLLTSLLLLSLRCQGPGKTLCCHEIIGLGPLAIFFVSPIYLRIFTSKHCRFAFICAYFHLNITESPLFAHIFI